MIKYFAYGSNLNLSKLKERGIEYQLIGKAVLKDWKLVFEVVDPEQEGVSYANIIPFDGEVVEGAVFEIDKVNRIKIDKYEGVPDFYVRDEVEVVVESGGEITCMTYLANPFSVSGKLKPTKSYLREILDSQEFFSQEYFKRLSEIETFD